MMKDSNKDPFLDRFLGSALGTFVGDALGEPVEGWPHRAISSRFGLLDTMLREKGRYTDDTQMMIGILETLVEKGGFDPAVCATKFQENFDPSRGYGRRIFGVVERIRQGTSWDRVGTDSFGNGGAMRIAPIGCFYYNDLQALKENAILSARITHYHPEGLAGAVAQATAVGLAFQHSLSNEPIEPEIFLDRITAQVIDIDNRFAEYLDRIKSMSAGLHLDGGGSMLEMIEAIAGQYRLSLRAIESVPAAIGAFVLTDTFQEAVVLAVNLGGDTDTIGAMAGAIAGAYYGYAQIPQEWLNVLENEAKGRDYIIHCVKHIVSSLLQAQSKQLA
ncbi:MAG: ADP-ribosylglycohydrolase family protein [Deltaproteobacteria bacterium]|nr:ADP-ribosylglycohydrolase family protein [Deltaproteobacteria bacterium]MBW2019471.1 ADP-ribosylglycohydrolase family protein [Deltaproteobacteria bacterium]MBW2074308.1 ADP-ribosylglycohydrolase family protein [Deltaproteobacteria bacterium]